MVFSEDECLYRAVYPKDRMDFFWTSEGRVSSAAFKDGNGLSVDRAAGRSETAAIKHMRDSGRDGFIFAISYSTCVSVSACVIEAPALPDNPYHCQIHKSESEIRLSNSQAREISKNVRLAYPDTDYPIKAYIA